MAKELKSFGLMQDASIIKIANLQADKEFVRILDLRSVVVPEVKTPLSTEEEFDDSMSGMDFDFDFESNGDTETPSPAPEQPAPPKDPFLPEEIDQQEERKEENTIETAAREMNFADGKLSLNLDISNVAYREMEIPGKPGKKKIYSELKKQFFDEASPAVMSFAYIKRIDDTYVGVSHEGKMELLEKLINLNRTVAKKRYHYSYIQTNEFALINALRFNYSLRADAITAILYIGVDSSRVTLVKGYDLLAELPIINEGANSKDTVKTLFSRLKLESSHLELANIDNYFIAGNGVNNSMLDYIKERQPEARVEYLLPLTLMDLIDYSDRYDETTLAEYIIPIMLAVLAALPKKQGLLRANFLPKQLREQQNFFSINAVGFTFLGLTLFAALISINTLLHLQTENRRIILEKESTQSQIEVSRAQVDSLNVIRQEISTIKQNIARSQLLIGERNQWHFIMEKISDNFSRNRINWLISLTNDQKGIKLTGRATNRLHIIALSRLFPDAAIQHINKDIVRDHTVWDYEIVFGMPDPLETKRLNYLRESRITNKSFNRYYNHTIEEIPNLLDGFVIADTTFIETPDEVSKD